MAAQLTPRVRVACARAAVVLIVVYALIDLVLQLLPPHYSVVSDAESDLAVGPFGWVMGINFVLRGVMSVLLVCALQGGVTGVGATRDGVTGVGATRDGAMRAGATRAGATGVGAVGVGRKASVRGRIGLMLLVTAGLCSVALVFFPTDVNAPGQFGMSQHTAIGAIHVVFATVGFVTVLVGMVLLTATRARTVLLAVALLGLVSLVLSLLLLPQIVGLAERLCLAGILGWALVSVAGEAGARPGVKRRARRG